MSELEGILLSIKAIITGVVQDPLVEIEITQRNSALAISKEYLTD
jgi:hypothetical protein